MDMIVDEIRIHRLLSPDAYPGSVPAIRHILAHGLRLRAGISIFIGENGSGKSTILHGIAAGYGFAPEGGHRTRRYASAYHSLEGLFDLSLESLPLTKNSKRADGFYHRGELARHTYSTMATYDVRGYEDADRLSAGQAIRSVAARRMTNRGLYILDEPETSLSLVGSIELRDRLHELAKGGAQVILATHSPVFASISNAELFECSEIGIRPTSWHSSEIRTQWQQHADCW